MTATTRGTGRISTFIFDTLRDRLITGVYPQGSRISVEAVRTEFSVSKQPVMEALRLLSADGLVEIIPQVGCMTPVYPLQEVRDFYDLFAAIEGQIASVAATRRTAAQLAQLARISEQIGIIHLHPDDTVRSRRYQLENQDFHRKVHEMAGSKIMADTSQRMWDLSEYLISTAGKPMPISSATDSRHLEHEDIRLALEAGDADAAREAMSAHIRATYDLIIDSQPKQLTQTAP